MDSLDFNQQYGGAAERASKELGVSPNIILAQWRLETANGKSIIPGTNNLGNIKDFRKDSDGVAATDNATGSVDKYRKFDSVDAFADHYVGLIKKKFPGALNTGDNAQHFAIGLKLGGYAEDPKYVEKLSNIAGQSSNKPAVAPAPQQSGELDLADFKRWQAQQNQVRPDTLDFIKEGADPKFVNYQLQKNPKAKALLDSGVPLPEVITQVTGDAHLGRIYESKAEADKRGFLGNAALNVAKVASDVVDNTKILANQLTGNDVEAKQQMDYLKQRDASPEQVALRDAPGGATGRFVANAVPAVVAGMVAPPSLLAQTATMAGVTGLQAGLEPAETLGQRVANAGEGAAIAGAMVGGTGLALKGLGATGRYLTQGNAATRAAAQTQLKAAEAQGLPITLSTVSPAWSRRLASTEGKQVATEWEAANAANVARANQQVAAQVAEKIGVPNYTGAIDSELLNTARLGNQQLYAKALDMPTVNVARTTVDDLLNIRKELKANGYNASANDIKNLVKQIPETAGAVKTSVLQDVITKLKNTAMDHSTHASERMAAYKAVGLLNDTLEASMSPAQQAIYKVANEQFKHIKAVDNMVFKSGDSGNVTAAQFNSSIKSGLFKGQFLKGDAPFQDLAKTLKEIKGLDTPVPNARGFLSKLLSNNLATGAMGYGLMSHPLGALLSIGLRAGGDKALNMIANYPSKTLVRMLGGASSKPLTTNPVAAQLAGVLSKHEPNPSAARLSPPTQNVVQAAPQPSMVAPALQRTPEPVLPNQKQIASQFRPPEGVPFPASEPVNMPIPKMPESAKAAAEAAPVEQAETAVVDPKIKAQTIIEQLKTRQAAKAAAAEKSVRQEYGNLPSSMLDFHKFGAEYKNGKIFFGEDNWSKLNIEQKNDVIARITEYRQNNFQGRGSADNFVGDATGKNNIKKNKIIESEEEKGIFRIGYEGSKHEVKDGVSKEQKDMLLKLMIM